MALNRRGTPRRARPAVQHATLTLPLPVTPTPAECGALLKSLIKHLLFQRAQIPYLYDELLRGAQQPLEHEAPHGEGARPPRRRRPPQGNRRLLKFLGKAEELMVAIDAALCTLGVPRRAFVLLGASTTRPREAYEVVLPPAAVGPPTHPAGAADAQAAARTGGQQQQQGAAQVDAASSPPPPPARVKPSRQERLCLLAMRQLVVASAQLPEGTAHTVPCKVFLLLEGGASNGDAAGAPASLADGGESGPLPVPPGFSVKRQFKLAMRKGVHLKLLLGQQPQAAAEPAPNQPAGQLQQGAGGSGGCGSSDDMETSSSCGGAGEEAPVTEHLSQLPDVASQLGPDALGGGARPSGSGTAGSVWYLCRAAVKGLNSGSHEDVAAEGFDGL